MDGRDVEPDNGLFQGEPWVRILLRRDPEPPIRYVEEAMDA